VALIVEPAAQGEERSARGPRRPRHRSVVGDDVLEHDSYTESAFRCGEYQSFDNPDSSCREGTSS